MNNIIKLVKIKLKGDYNLNKQISKNSNKTNKYGMKLLFGFLIIYAIIYMFIIAKTIIKGLLVINTPFILPVVFMVLSSCLILLTDIYKVNGNLFKTKDFDLLNSLPIKNSEIILSKLITIYIENMLLVFMLMIPQFIVYLIYVPISISFIIYFILTIFLIPIIPMIIATIIGTIITFLASLFNKVNLMNYIFSFILFLIAFYFGFNSNDMSSSALASLGTMIVNRFNKIYPLTNTYLSIIKDGNILSFIIFLIIPIILLLLFLMVMKKYYITINTKLNSTFTKRNYKLKELNTNSPLIALLKKDIKRFYGSYLYVLNTCMGAIILTIGSICLVIFGPEEINIFFENDQIIKLITSATPLLIGSFCLLNSTTQASISIEGKSFNLLKSLPISPNLVFISKILTNFTIFIPMIFINVTILAITLKLSIFNYIISLIIPLIYALFISLIGLILNLKYPNFDWENEVSVIKQSIPAFATIMIGMLLAVLPIGIITNIKNIDLNLVTLIITIVLIIINIILINYLKNKGVKRFNEL